MTNADSSPGDKKAAEAVIDATRRLYIRGLNSTMSGNVSARTGPDTMLITPAGLDKALLSQGQLSVVRISDESRIDTGGYGPSSEFRVHTRIYRAFPEANAVVHPHPPYSLSIVSAMGREVLAALESNEEEYGYYVGRVGVVKGRAGTEELADAVAAEAGRGATVIVMEDHGTVGLGGTMREALGRVEALEHMAKRYYLTEVLKRKP